MTEVDWLSEFARRRSPNFVPTYDDREGRNRWAASVVKTFPGETILNLGGGGKRHLQKFVSQQQHVHEVDITGDCDTRLNLDAIECLPFDDGSFDTCCAFEVLEHLEQLHLICEEMYRVAKSTLFISLPNSAVEMVEIWHNRKTYNNPAQNGVYSKFYGLPLAVPEDRHRWWLTFEDIVRFFVIFEQSKRCNVTFYAADHPRSLKQNLFRVLAGERLYLNLFCNSVWVKIEK